MRDCVPVMPVEAIVRDAEDEVVEGVQVSDEDGGFGFLLGGDETVLHKDRTLGTRTVLTIFKAQRKANSVAIEYA